MHFLKKYLRIKAYFFVHLNRMQRHFSAWLHPDGWRFVGIFAFFTVLLSFLSSFLGFIGVVLTSWCAYFFRNPARVVPSREGLIVSPADGKIVSIQTLIPPASFALGEESRVRISIFLNIFDVHVNRISLPGRIERIVYHQGLFLNASTERASDLNERNTLVIDIGNGNRIGITQIAGLIARRIRCDVRMDQQVSAGEVFGLIRFGSRVDVYLPTGINPLVVEGQRMIAGETVLADMSSHEEPRQGLLI
jgi:phosphatidylserine decarboxylase